MRSFDLARVTVTPPLERALHGEAERYLVAVKRAISAEVSGDSRGARSTLQLIRGKTQAMPAWQRPELGPDPPFREHKRPSFSKRRAAETFVRDRFQCRYCGQRLVPVCVMSALSAGYPDEFPYNEHYKAGAIHRAYWLIGAEADHLLPVSRGGDGTALDNHATACVLCNTRKADRTLNELGWSCMPPTDVTWDGCVPMYRELLQRLQTANPHYHEQWLHAFEKVGGGLPGDETIGTDQSTIAP